MLKRELLKEGHVAIVKPHTATIRVTYHAIPQKNRTLIQSKKSVEHLAQHKSLQQIDKETFNNKKLNE
jgi:hypothetical protein